MRRILSYILITITLIYCSDLGKSKGLKNEKQNTYSTKDSINNTHISNIKDTLSNYWPIRHDTLRFRKKIMIDRNESLLFVKKYSLNDSSVINSGIGDKNIFIDFSHASVVDLELFLDTISIQERINKEDFKNLFQSNDLKKMDLMSIGIDSVSNDIIYFTSDIGIPDTDILWEIKYSIEIVNKSFDSLKIEKIDYIGM